MGYILIFIIFCLLIFYVAIPAFFFVVGIFTAFG